MLREILTNSRQIRLISSGFIVQSSAVFYKEPIRMLRALAFASN